MPQPKINSFSAFNDVRSQCQWKCWMAAVCLWATAAGCGGDAGDSMAADALDPEEAAVVKQEEVDAGPSEAEVAEKAAILAYPPLTDENCEAFLLDWHIHHREPRIILSTRFGQLELELFDDVPLHSANFRYKISRKYYAPSEFVRVVPDFVVQGGNSEETRAQEMRWLIGKHTLPAEFREEYRHFRGALAMGRTYQDNPEKRSASYDFYIVVGRAVTRMELMRLEREKGFQYSETQKLRYETAGGTPHLDQEHTVFGQVVSGWDVLDSLSQVQTDDSDWPLLRLELNMGFSE